MLMRVLKRIAGIETDWSVLLLTPLEQNDREATLTPRQLPPSI